MAENNKANHFDQIGWFITSFFLIFLGTILPEFISWANNQNNTDKFLSSLIIISTMFFGFIIARLFLRSQWRKMKDYKKADKFFSNLSIWLYLLLILSIEIILSIILFIFDFISFINLILLVFIGIILILIDVFSD